jgi:ubiquitin-conjugating enzyme E2 Q
VLKKQFAFKDKHESFGKSDRMLRHLKKWLIKNNGQKKRKNSNISNTCDIDNNLHNDPFLFTSDSRIIFQRTLIRTSFGRIITESDDDILDKDDVQLFMNLVHKFEVDNIRVVKVKYLVNEELYKQFNARKQKLRSKGSSTTELLVFHGTRKDNINGIIKHGFKIGGINGHPVTHGTNYGKGIYTDKDGIDSRYYCYNDYCVVACQSLPGRAEVDSITPGGKDNWIIFKKPDQLLPCYVVYFETDNKYEPLLPLPEHFITNIEEISDTEEDENSENSENIKHQEEVNKQKEQYGHKQQEQSQQEELLRTNGKGIKKRNDYAAAAEIFSSCLTNSLPVPASKTIQKQLMHVLRTQMSQHEKERGWILNVDKMDRLDLWEVSMIHFDSDLPLVKDLIDNELDRIQMEFTFPSDYPASPPFARVVYPRLLRFMDGGGGHVEAGGAICVQLLTSSGWNPKFNMEGVFQIAHALLSTTNPPARLAKNWSKPYTMEEAKAAFARVAKIHNWEI